MVWPINRSSIIRKRPSVRSFHLTDAATSPSMNPKCHATESGRGWLAQFFSITKPGVQKRVPRPSWVFCEGAEFLERPFFRCHPEEAHAFATRRHANEGSLHFYQVAGPCNREETCRQDRIALGPPFVVISSGCIRQSVVAISARSPAIPQRTRARQGISFCVR